MYAESELVSLIELATKAGATIITTRDEQAWKKEGRNIIETVLVCQGIPGIGKHPASGMAACEALRAAKAKGYLGPVIKSVEFREIPHTGELRAFGLLTTGDEAPICDFDPHELQLSENDFMNMTTIEAHSFFQHKLATHAAMKSKGRPRPQG